MIAVHHHRGRVRNLLSLERVQHPTHLKVEPAHRAVVCVTHGPSSSIGHSLLNVQREDYGVMVPASSTYMFMCIQTLGHISLLLNWAASHRIHRMHCRNRTESKQCQASSPAAACVWPVAASRGRIGPKIFEACAGACVGGPAGRQRVSDAVRKHWALDPALTKPDMMKNGRRCVRNKPAA